MCPGDLSVMVQLKKTLFTCTYLFTNVQFTLINKYRSDNTDKVYRFSVFNELKTLILKV